MKIKLKITTAMIFVTFKVNTFASNNSLQDIGEFEGCSYADMDIDEYSEPYIRIQLENENLTLLQN